MRSLIERLAADQRASGKAVQEPASTEEVAGARQDLEARLGARLPEGYVALLTQANGIAYNGLVLYGAGQDPERRSPGEFWQGLLAANLLWREGPGHDGYLILGDTGLELLTVDLDGSGACLRDKISGEVNEAFDTIEAAIETCLRRHL